MKINNISIVDIPEGDNRQKGIENPFEETMTEALAGVVQWTEQQPANKEVAGVIPSHSTGLSCRSGPQ